jgi:DNA-binding SARP family transcriptional activator/predicted ATPase
MARFELTFLGSCTARLDGVTLHGFASGKVRLLLAYLAVEGSRPHPRDLLVEIFWPEHPSQAAHASLRSALSNLRLLLKSNPTDVAALETDRDTVQLHLSDDGRVDVIAFEEEISQAESILAHSEDLPSAMAHFQSAIDLYHGDFLQGFTLKDCPQFDDWAYFVRERLRHKASAALLQLAGCCESRAEYEQAIHFARRWIELEPWQESAHRLLMRLLAQAGRRTEALEQYHECCQVLADELDVQPAAETTRLYEQIRDEKVASQEKRTPGLLPSYLTTFIGREKELAEIAALLHDPNCRLLSIIGPGGSGKTRLAVKAASREGARFQDGTCFVPLVAAENAAAILPILLQALGVTTPSADLQHAMFSFICKKELLLVLDNFEQLLYAGAELLIEILQATPQVKLLVTSRERLHLEAEWIYQVEGLSLPSPAQAAQAWDFDAIRLFTTIAQGQRGYPISDKELPDATHICRLVSGMPLAIKIAAGWTRALTCSEIASEIEHSLGFLESDDRDLQARHRSVQAVFEHTWWMLSPEEQAVFRKLSVFRGGFTRPAAETVAGASLHTLTALVDQCLVTHRPSGRYELHELLRQFAEDKLGKDAQEEEHTRTAHSHFYLEFIQKVDYLGPEMAANIPLVQADLDNLRAAWFRAAAQGDYMALEPASDPLLDFYGVMVWYSQALTLLEETLSILPGSPPAQFLTLLLTQKARRLMTLGKESDGLKILSQIQELADRNDLQAIKAHIHRTMALTHFKDDFQESIQNYEESNIIDHNFGESGSIANSIMWMGIIWFTKGFLSKGEACFYESLRLCREIQFLNNELHCVRMLVTTSLVKGDLPAAIKLNQELQSIVARIGVPGAEVYPLCSLGLLAWRQGCFGEANRVFEQGLKALQDRADLGEAGWLPVIAHYHVLYCQVLEDEGEYEAMQCQALQAIALYRQVGFYHEWFYPLLEPLIWLGGAEMHLGDYASAHQHLAQFIHDCLSNRYTDWALFGLYFYAELLVKEDPSPKSLNLALELLSLVLSHPRLEGIDYHPAILGKLALPTLQQAADELAVSLTDEEAAAARLRGQKLDLIEIANDLLAGRGRYWIE